MSLLYILIEFKLQHFATHELHEIKKIIISIKKYDSHFYSIRRM